MAKVWLQYLYNDPNLADADLGDRITELACSKSTKLTQDDKNELLRLSCRHGMLANFKQLAKVADVNVVDELGCNLLSITASSFDKKKKVAYGKIIEELLNGGLDCTKLDKYGQSAEHYIAAHGDLEAVELLCKKDEKGNKGNIQPDDARLFMAMYSGGNKAVIEYLKEELNKIDIKARDQGGNSVLHYVAASFEDGGVDTLKELLEKGADCNAQNQLGMTPLMLAIISNDIGKVRVLLEHPEINPNSVDMYGNTALMAACALGNSHKEIIAELLKDRRVNINYLNKKSESALALAAVSGAEELDLEKVKAKVGGTKEVNSEKTKEAEAGRREIMEALIDSGADPLFGSNSPDFKIQMLFSVLKYSLFYVANKFALAFSPFLQRGAEFAMEWNFASDVADSVSQKVKNEILNLLSEKKLSLENTSTIGNYHINKLGVVIHGDSLKNALKDNYHYEDKDKSIATKQDLENREKSENKLTSYEKWQMHESFARKYERIRYTLDNSTLLPWTRRGLESVAKEIFKADRALNFKIDKDKDITINSFRENFGSVRDDSRF